MIRFKDLRPHILRLHHFDQCFLQDFSLDIQKRGSGIQHLGFGCIAMPRLRKLIERIEHPASETLIPLLPETHFGGNLIGCLKPNSPDIIRQPVRILCHNLYAVIPIGLVDFGGM